MIDRLKFKRLHEDEEEEKAKSEFRRKIMTVQKYREDDYNTNEQLLISKLYYRRIGVGETIGRPKKPEEDMETI